jgi:hypothetical protein
MSDTTTLPDRMLSPRELDARVAERLFDWTITYLGEHGALGIRAGHSVTKDVPSYSFDPAAMMEVFNELVRRGFGVAMGNGHASVWCRIDSRQVLTVESLGYADAPTLPRAVCLAALAAADAALAPPAGGDAAAGEGTVRA